jgi:SAM-dependent methyltransferase
MTSDMYDEGYWERGVGSNYVDYGDDPGWFPSAVLLAGLLGDTRESPRVFEVGAAKGWFLLHARGIGLDAWGMDISDWAVRHAELYVRPYLRVGNAAVDPIRLTGESPYDAVVSWEFLEHVPVDELAAVLANMEDAVAPGGLLLHRIGIGGMGDVHEHEADVTHQPAQPREWWEELGRARGWEPRPDLVRSFDETFAGRDWAGRYFAWTR